jgi:hypothetical protein
MKDTFYFSHDYNCRSDVKIKKLVRTHGTSGYGIYWMLIEDLYNNANALPLDYDGIAYELRCDCDIVKSVINDFELFVIDGDTFGSLSVQKRLSDRDEKSKKARESASKRWGSKDDNTNAMRSHSDSNAIKERKEKEIKGKETKDNALHANIVEGFSFEDLIEVYPKVNSHKVETLALFNNLDLDEKKKCITFANQLQQIWKQNGIQDKYQFMKSCHTFVELKMFNGKPEDIFPREISTEIKELNYAHEDLELMKRIEERKLERLNKRKQYEETIKHQ